jgi:uncharacterized membrane protein YtjA (UPF0391 family)
MTSADRFAAHGRIERSQTLPARAARNVRSEQPERGRATRQRLQYRLQDSLHDHPTIIEGTAMLYYSIVFFVIAIIAAIFGFGGIAAGAAGIAKILFVIFVILFIVSLFFRGRRP